ncbi:MAG: hypothetical protein OXH07_07800 [Chloroflexi bacterium]|nr:hypothetical protein [Chloroflexota bacterium]
MSRLAVAALGVLLGLAVLAPGAAQEAETATIEVRVWQNVGDELDIYVSARPAAGSWRTLGTIPLALDDGISSTGRFRYGDIDFDVPLLGRADPATVEVRVWQDVDNSARVYISARPADGDWGVFGTIRLPLDDGVSSSGRFRYGNVRLDVPLPPAEVATLAGHPGSWGYADGRGAGVRFGRGGPTGLVVDHDGSVVVADPWNHAIRRISPDGRATTIAGGLGAGFRDGPVGVAQFAFPVDVALASDGSIYVADADNRRIRRIGPGGVVTTVAGTDPETNVADFIRDGPALEAILLRPIALALDARGNLYISDGYRIRVLSAAGEVFTLAGGRLPGYRDGPAKAAEFRIVSDMDVDDAGNLYVLDVSNTTPGERGAYATIRVVSTAGMVRTLHASDEPRYGGMLAWPSGIVVTGRGEVFVSNTGRHQIVRLGADGELHGVAGAGEDGRLDGSRARAQFSFPRDLAVAGSGDLFVVDQQRTVIRRVSRGASDVPLAVAPHVPTVEGVTVTILSGLRREHGLVDGPAGRARFQYPEGLALAPGGVALVVDSQNHAIRRVGADGSVTTLAGGNGEGVRDGPASEAQFSTPRDIAVGPDGTAYVIDEGTGLIRKVAADGSVETLQDEMQAAFPDPRAIAVDRAGNLYVLNGDSATIRRLSPEGHTSTVAWAVHPGGIAVDADGFVYYPADGVGDRAVAIKKASPEGVVTTVYESPPFLHGGLLGHVADIALGPDGSVYLAEWSLDGLLRISPDGEASFVIPPYYPDGPVQPRGLAVSPDGGLLVADHRLAVIWRVTFEDEPPE